MSCSTHWNNRFYNALQEKNWDGFVSEIGYLCVLATFYIALSVYQLYLNQWLQIRWRRWMTANYLGEWLHDANHYRMQLKGDAADNPDQRIADDVKTVRRSDAEDRRRPVEFDRHAGDPLSSSCGAFRPPRRCTCSAASSQFPAISSGAR